MSPWYKNALWVVSLLALVVSVFALGLPLVMHWHADPQWYALPISLFALVVNLIALPFYIKMYRQAQRSTRSDVQRDLFRQEQETNELIARFDVRGPYAVSFEINDQDLPGFNKKVAVLFKLLNWLQVVYHQRNILEQEQVEGYQKQMAIVGRWIVADQQLLDVWNACRENRDLGPPNCQAWLEQHLRGKGRSDLKI